MNTGESPLPNPKNYVSPRQNKKQKENKRNRSFILIWE